MIKIENSTYFCLINTKTGEKTRYFESEEKLILEIQKMVKKEFHMLRLPPVETALRYVKFGRSEEEGKVASYQEIDHSDLTIVTFPRFILIEDNYGRIVPINKLHGVFYNYTEEAYNTNLKLSNPYNRKAKLKEKDNGFRNAPVSGTGKKNTNYGRQISYKQTKILFDDDQSKEYGVKSYRKRNVLDAFDIEPLQDPTRSWKDNTKAKKQWMKHKHQAKDTRSIRKMYTKDDEYFDMLDTVEFAS